MPSVRLLAVLLAVAVAVTLAGAPRSEAQTPSIGIYRSEDPGSVNVYWIRAPAGLVVVDSARSLTDARRALEHIRRENRPVVAILVTHAHPDHVGGLGVFQDAFPGAPILASAAARRFMATDPLRFFEQTRQSLAGDYANPVRLPNRIIRDGETLRVGGLTIRTAEIGPGEAESHTLFYLPSSHTLFPGDVVSNEATPALIEGHSCGWLQDLNRLGRRFPRADLSYPGHGNVSETRTLVEAQRRYIERFRRLVRRRIAPASDAGRQVSPAERRAIVASMERRYPGYLPVAGIPDLLGENVEPVARELRSEPRRPPRPCRAS
jgi:glyoxylase-like metal-dependent hydrolase (beta-lactamase superfamily II)